MSWKPFFGFLFFLLAIGLLIVYWFFPFDTVDFSISGEKNTNFTLENGNIGGAQFYENLRYQEPRISYKIKDCGLQKADNMQQAFERIENITILDFYPITSNEQISVTCDDKAKFEGRFFVAGEGGPTNITQAGNFNVIQHGGIQLLRDVKCEKPNVETHELLHAIGFDHSTNPSNVMYPTSKCSQEIGQDTIDLINTLYAFPTQPDLVFEEANASMSGRYLDLNFIVKNYGLRDSLESEIEIYADNKSVKTLEVEPIPIGGGRGITLKNLFVFQKDVNEIKLEINYGSNEIKKDNNIIFLKIKN